MEQKCLLNLIHVFLPKKNNVPKSINKIYKEAGYDKKTVKEDLYCSDCNNVLNQEKICLNESCNVFASENKDFNSFSFVEIKDQVKSIIETYHEEIICYNGAERNFNDLCDGDYYQKIKKDNYLHLMVYTDGVELSKSSNISFWPVFVGLVELPKSIRDSKRNKIICGVWYGKKKPSSNILFNRLIEEVNDMNLSGLNGKVRNNYYKFQIGLYGFIGDTPAKAIATCMTQFNGYFGCPYCLNPGK